MKNTPFKNIGDLYGDFKVTNIIDIHELQCQLRELIHLPTNAKILHIANDDPENVFCLSFQTIPENSNGVAHILEHIALCGSKKYPMRDPFFSMRRRSLNTYMNAMTGPDFTCYPAASQIPKDFYNLLEVYLDAVFRPLLNEMSFLQEGHRLEFTIPDDSNSPLEFKGVVFNEMKGCLSSPGTRLFETINKNLFPNLTYGVNSGGDPKDIPSLTYQELRDFHDKFYHPSRCLFYFYGNMPLEDHLDFIAEHSLEGTVRKTPLPKLPKQQRFTIPIKATTHYPISEEEDTANKTWISFAWLTCDILQQEEQVALSVLEIALLDTDASPLKQALLQSQLCTQISSFIEGDITEAPWIITLQGCEPENADRIEKFLFEALGTIVKEGIPQKLIDNALHQFELYRSEITGGSYPFGLSLFMRSALLKQHGVNPQEGLMIHSIFQRLRERMNAEPNMFTHLISKYLINNPHFVRVVMTPDKELATRELDEEKQTLTHLQKKLKKDQIDEIIAKAKALKTLQVKESEKELDILPIIHIADVPKDARDFPLIHEQNGALNIYRHECFTNNILYTDLTFPLQGVTKEELTDLRLFLLLFPQVGCGGRTYAENLEYIQAHTGGVSASFSLNVQVTDYLEYSPYLTIQGKALNRKADKLFTLYNDLLSSVDFTNVARLKEVLLKHYTSLENSLHQNPLNYAINLSSSGLNPTSAISNESYGLPYYHNIKKIVQDFDNCAENLVQKMLTMKQRLLNVQGAHLVLSCQKDIADELRNENFFGLPDISMQKSNPWYIDIIPSPIESQGRTISSPVAFTSKVFNTIPYVHPDSPAINVAANLFDNTILHTRIREQGGAYGGGASHNSHSGSFFFYSYRDPNIFSTVQAFEEATREMIKGNFTEADLEEAKLEMVQGIDAPVAPGSRANVAYHWMRKGQTLERRQAVRDRLLSLTKQDVISAIEKHILPKLEKSATVTFSGKDLLAKENTAFTDHNLKPLKILPIT